MNNTSIVVHSLLARLQAHSQSIQERALFLSLIDMTDPAAAVRIRGIIEGLFLADTLTEQTRQELINLTYNPQEEQRPGRDNLYTVQILTEKGNNFDFEVAATNPLDAYFQLTRRSSYKAIADIIKVNVFDGPGADINTATPVKCFGQDELVFNSLNK